MPLDLFMMHFGTNKDTILSHTTKFSGSPAEMDLLSAIRLSVRVQNLIGVSPYSVSKKDGVSAKGISVLPGVVLFICSMISGYYGSQTSFQAQAGRAMDTSLDLGSVLLLTMVVGGIFQMLAYIFTFFLSLWFRKSTVEFYKKLLRIGTKMQKVGIIMDFRYLSRFHAAAVCVLVFYHSTQLTFGLLVIWNTPDNYHLAITYTLIYLSNTFSAKDFIMVCQAVAQHFSCLQAVLKEVQLEQDEFPHRLETFYAIHGELCDCFDLITENFGLRELLNVISDFIFMTSQLFFSFWSADRGQFEFAAFGMIIILIPRCLKVSLVMYSGEQLIRMAHSTSKMLQKLDRPFKRAEFHDLAHNFALHVIHLRELDITAKNFFSLRLAFFFTIISACVMYFIVLIQFRLREE